MKHDGYCDGNKISNHISRIPLLTGNSCVIDSNGSKIQMKNICYGTKLITNNGQSTVLKVIIIQYDGYVSLFNDCYITGGTPFITEHGYSDIVENLSKCHVRYTGKVYNVILENGELLKITGRSSSSIYIASCGFKTSIKFFEESVFHGNAIRTLILRSFQSFIVDLKEDHFKHNIEENKNEIDREKITMDQNYSYLSNLLGIVKMFYIKEPQILPDECLPVDGKQKEDDGEIEKMNNWIIDRKHNVLTDHLEKGTYWKFYELNVSVSSIFNFQNKIEPITEC